jgi:hypothetical protein
MIGESKMVMAIPMKAIIFGRKLLNIRLLFYYFYLLNNFAILQPNASGNPIK